MYDNWRFLELTAPIKEIFATEEALTNSVNDGPILMIWRSKPHSVSIPVREDSKVIDKDKCILLGAEWSRRMTDGEVIYHNHLTDFAFSMIVPSNGDSNETKKELLEIVKGALRHIGVPAEITGSEITVDGKIISSASHYSAGDALVVHGFVFFEVPSFLTGHQMIRSNKSVGRRAREHIENSAAITEYVNTSFSNVVNSFLETVRCEKMFLRSHELKQIQSLLENKYNNDNWQLHGHIYS